MTADRQTVTVELAADEVLVALKRGEEYEDVHPELVSEDAIGDRWPEYRTIQPASQAPAEGDDMLVPLIYAAIMHNGKPKTVAEFERAAANVADMLQRRAEVTHNKPVASIYISDDGSREFDDWRVDLPPGNHLLFTAPRPDQPQPESLPHPGTPEAEEMIEKLLAEYNRPSNMKNAARAGYMAAKRLLQNARQPLPAVEDAAQPNVQPKGTPAATVCNDYNADGLSARIDTYLPAGTVLYTEPQAPAPAPEGKLVGWCELTAGGQIAYFDGKPMVMPGPVGNDCHPHPLYVGAAPCAAVAQQVPRSFVLVKSPITEDMHQAACKVLARATGLDGTPQRVLDALAASGPKPPVQGSES